MTLYGTGICILQVQRKNISRWCAKHHLCRLHNVTGSLESEMCTSDREEERSQPVRLPKVYLFLNRFQKHCEIFTLTHSHKSDQLFSIFLFHYLYPFSLPPWWAFVAKCGHSITETKLNLKLFSQFIFILISASVWTLGNRHRNMWSLQSGSFFLPSGNSVWRHMWDQPLHFEIIGTSQNAFVTVPNHSWESFICFQ